MAFSANDRVRVTSQSHPEREKLGTVAIAAEDAADGYNHVRLDGYAVGRTLRFADNELGTTNFVSPVQYS
jgi:hypothetical protein